MRTIITYLHIRAINDTSNRGFLQLGQRHFPCFLGRNGRTAFKREGDGKSPKGKWRLVQAYFRPDKMGRLKTLLSIKPLRVQDGWCDAVGDRNYNCQVMRPYAASHEDLWRADDVYDVLVTTSHNQCPRIQGFGSAIFLHQMGEAGTAGCIALRPRDLKLVLAACSRETYLVI